MKIFKHFILLTLVTLGSLQFLNAQEQSNKPSPYLLNLKLDFGEIANFSNPMELLMIDSLVIQKNILNASTTNIQLGDGNEFKEVGSTSKDSLIGYFLTDYVTKKTYKFDANKKFVEIVNNKKELSALMFLKTDSAIASLAPKYVLKGDTLLNGQKCKIVVYEPKEKEDSISQKAYLAERIKNEKFLNVLANSLEQRFNGTCVAIEFHDIKNPMKGVHKIGFSFDRNMDPEERKLANFFYDWFQKQKKENLPI